MPYVPTDEERFVALFGDPEVMRWVGDGPQPEAANRSLFGRVFDVYAKRRFDVWGIWLDGEYVGHAEIKPSPTQPGHEIVYALARAVWGRRLGTEVVEALVGYGFSTLGLTEVYATVAAPNAASLAVLSRAGFHHVRDIDDDVPPTRVLRRAR